MGEKAVSRPWTKEEDDLLKLAIQTHGTRDNWKAVAEAVPGRTNKACRKRWLHSLSPGVKKTAWSPEEDNVLVELYRVHGPKWSYIARHIEGRTDDACSKRYNEALDPNLKKHSWTPEEDNQLLFFHAELGEKWVDIGKRMQRGGLACRNRYKLLERKGLIHAVPYYPPESYHLFQPEIEPSTSFREPTPAPETLPPSTDPPPFQFSSSSLSAALFDPPRISQQSNEDPNANYSSLYSPAPLPPETPSHSGHPSPDGFHDDPTMSLDDQMDHSVPIQTNVQLQDIPTVYTYDGYAGALVSLNPGICPSGPSRVLHSSETQTQITFENGLGLGLGLDKPPHAYPSLSIPSLEEINSSYYNSFSESSSTDASPDIQGLEDLSSASSSPSNTQDTLSLTSSPNASSPVELPGNETPFPGSLLFSSNPAMPAPLSSTRPRMSVLRKRQPDSQRRLSSVMTIGDGSIRPYACGHHSCWPTSSDTSKSCFATSRELFEHHRLHEHHEGEGIEEKPFRCALQGCGRSWKSMNGLQYHLQVSTAHFQQALSSRLSSQLSQSAGESGESSQTNASESQEGSPAETGKRFACDQAGCFKSYKTPSGLRYHKQHGHPKKLPMQLNNVPPALVRDLNKKMRKGLTVGS